MNTAKKQSPWTFVKGSTTISKSGAVIVVKELNLTDAGRRAITSGSKGINEGVAEEAGPKLPQKRLIPA